MEPSLIHLRPSIEADCAFCYRVKKEAIGQYVTQIWGWNEAFQREFHARAALHPEIVVYNSQDIGTIEIRRELDHIHLGEFYLLPQFQRQGIGTLLLQRVIEQAQAARLPMRLEVFKINPVQSLYQRHGFAIVGHQEHHFLMERAIS